MKICATCNTLKAIEDFRVDARSNDGRQYVCRPCMKIKDKSFRKRRPESGLKSRNEWEKRNLVKRSAMARIIREKNPDRGFVANLRNSYGMEPEEYNRMHARQGGLCAICLLPECHVMNGKIKRLSVDHCHETGRIRALLCAKCNHAIGMIKDNHETALKMAQYLLRHKNINSSK